MRNYIVLASALGALVSGCAASPNLPAHGPSDLTTAELAPSPYGAVQLPVLAIDTSSERDPSELHPSPYTTDREPLPPAPPLVQTATDREELHPSPYTSERDADGPSSTLAPKPQASIRARTLTWGVAGGGAPSAYGF